MQKPSLQAVLATHVDDLASVGSGAFLGDLGVVARGQGKEKRRKCVHGRMGEYGCPSGEQSGSERWAESRWSISCFVVCQEARELGCFVAPSSSYFHSQNDMPAAT